MPPPLPSPGIPGTAHALPDGSPTASTSNLPNVAGSRSTSNGSGPAAGSTNGLPAVDSPHLPRPRNQVFPLFNQSGSNGHQRPHMPPLPSHQTQLPPAPPAPNGNCVQQQPQNPAQLPPPQVNGLASPSAGPIRDFSQEYLDMADMIKKTKPNVVRHVIRDHWERALLGSQYHIAFILNATMHQANPETLSRAVQDFGGRMIQESKPHVIRHLSAEGFDEVADLLLSKVSNKFLDKAIARRLETIPARELVNALARAERLGYDVQDIVEERGPGVEHVIPSIIPQMYPPMLPQSFPQGAQQPVPPAAQSPSEQQTPVPLPSMPQLPATGRPQKQPKIIDQQDLPRQGPNGSLYCVICLWPCAGQDALDYHTKKRACGKWLEWDRVGRELCPFCGCRFGSSGGLSYHLKTQVCGNYSDEMSQTMTTLIDDYFVWSRGAAERDRERRPHGCPSLATPQEITQHGTPQQVKSQSGTPGAASESDWVTPGNDPYSKLTPQQRQEFENDMKEAEDFYGKLMRDATELPEPEQTKTLAALKNRYNTKQSVTRKKYGIRLRERRSKNQIAAERSRLFGSANGPSLSGSDRHASTKRARASEGTSATPAAQPSSTAEPPRKRVALSDMGGLTGSSATAETTDPTAFLTSSQPRHLQQQSAASVTSNGTPAAVTRGTQEDPMAIDDDSDGDSDSDDDDIPASLPK
ncbi:Fc.00g064400.m01.CDS01 [Cosmosporella sp. VM-42]